MVVGGVVEPGVEVIGLNDAQGPAGSEAEVDTAASLEGKGVDRAGTAGCDAPFAVSAAEQGLGEGRQARVFAEARRGPNRYEVRVRSVPVLLMLEACCTPISPTAAKALVKL